MKIDTSKIEGYAEMTPEQKVAAIEAYEIEEPKDENSAKWQNQLNRANSDAAEWKRKFRETQSESERKAAEIADEIAAKDAKIAEYEARDRVNTYTVKLTAAGYDAVTAANMAKDLPAGIPDSFFDSHKAYMDAHDKAFAAKQMAETPAPTGGKSSPDYESMTDDEYYRAVRK